MKLKFVIILFFVTYYQSFFAIDDKDQKEKIISVGFTSSLFNEVDTRDAVVAIKMWGDELLRNMDVNFTPDSKIFQTQNHLVNAINNNEIILISLPVIDYLQIKDKVSITPYLITSLNNKYGNNFFLIVRKESKYKNLIELKNSSINLPNGTSGQLVEMWLTNILQDKKESFNTFFSETKYVSKPSQAILPVFFKQADACIINESALETMIELNPQLQKDLAVIERSPMFLNGMMCVNNSTDEVLRDSVISVAQKISDSASGKQILTLFKSDKIIMYDEKYIKATLELFNKYMRIREKK